MALKARTVDGDELRQLIPMRAAIEAVRNAYIASARGEFSAVPRVGTPSHTLFLMPSERMREGHNLGQSVKVVSYHEENSAAGLPVVQGVVLWFDGADGQARLVIDGESVTALRTGAASGVATDFFAPPTARRLAVIGSGAAAPDQARAVCAVRDIHAITIAARELSKSQKLARSLATEFAHIDVVATATVHEAVAEADVICTATTARAPLFQLSDVRPDVHINAIGAFSPEMCEIGPDIVGSAQQICVDDRAALRDCGDLSGPLRAGQIQPDQIALIGDLLPQGHRSMNGGISLFKSIGVAAQDWAIASCVAAAVLA